MNELKAIIGGDQDLIRGIVQIAVQEFLDAAMNESLGTAKGERTEGRLGFRGGHYPRTLITRAGTLELRVPRDRQTRFSTEIFSRYQRSESSGARWPKGGAFARRAAPEGAGKGWQRALVAALIEMYVQGATREIKAVSEELCGHEFSASTISELNATLDEDLKKFARRRLEGEHPCLILNARYERLCKKSVF